MFTRSPGQGSCRQCPPRWSSVFGATACFPLTDSPTNKPTKFPTDNARGTSPPGPHRKRQEEHDRSVARNTAAGKKSASLVAMLRARHAHKRGSSAKQTQGHKPMSPHKKPLNMAYVDSTGNNQMATGSQDASSFLWLSILLAVVPLVAVGIKVRVCSLL